MTVPILVSGETYARLCEAAAGIWRDTGRAASFAEVLDKSWKGSLMAEVNETSQRQCDRCGTQSEPAAKGSVPAGWLIALGLRAADGFTVLHDLCPSCASLPVLQAVVLPAAQPAVPPAPEPEPQLPGPDGQ